MRLPNAAHTSRPWRIHELTRDFRLEDVWALSTPGGPDDFPRLVDGIASGDPSQGSSRAVRTLFAIRWKVGKLLGWDGPDAGLGSRVPTLRERLPVDLRDAPSGPGLRRASLHLAVPARRRVGGGDRQPNHARSHAHRLGLGSDGRLPRPDGGLREAKRPARDRLHGRDQAVPAPDRVPADVATDRAAVADTHRLGSIRPGGSVTLNDEPWPEVGRTRMTVPRRPCESDCVTSTYVRARDNRRPSTTMAYPRGGI